MKIWLLWWKLIRQLRAACSRERTFLWMTVVLIGFVIRPDLLGVTSIIRAIGLSGIYYDRLLDFFHSGALNIERLTAIWISIVLRLFPLIRVNGRIVLLGDGLKAAKAGKKMPAVKKLHQQSESNTKPSYIFGHSLQAIAVLAGTQASVFAVPLISRIHEGLKFTNRDKRSLVDKMVNMLLSLSIDCPYYFVADAYYAARQVIREAIKRGYHLISRVRMNAVAYYPAIQPDKRGRGAPRKFGSKIHLRTLFDNKSMMAELLSPVYGEQNVVLLYRCIDLVWKSAGQLVRFVAVIHPTKGRIIIMSTDLALSAREIIQLYGLRFKIEVSFKQAIRTMGVYAYHFWMADMHAIGRKGKNQHLHHETDEYRQKVRRKMDAYHRFIQLGLIAQGSLQYLACCYSDIVWKCFGSWIRTIRPEILPSEMVTRVSMKNSMVDFFAGSAEEINIVKFVMERLDVEQSEGAKLAAA
jgi:hypothetical protein